MTEIALGTTEFGTDAAPADLVIDRAGTVFWTDEYGDIVGSVVTRRRSRELAHRPLGASHRRGGA